MWYYSILSILRFHDIWHTLDMAVIIFSAFDKLWADTHFPSPTYFYMKLTYLSLDSRRWFCLLENMFTMYNISHGACKFIILVFRCSFKKTFFLKTTKTTNGPSKQARLARYGRTLHAGRPLLVYQTAATADVAVLIIQKFSCKFRLLSRYHC